MSTSGSRLAARCFHRLSCNSISLPTGLKDVSQYPNLIRALLEASYSEGDIAKICGGNLLRVWREVEKVADELQSAQPDSV